MRRPEVPLRLALLLLLALAACEPEPCTPVDCKYTCFDLGVATTGPTPLREGGDELAAPQVLTAAEFEAIRPALEELRAGARLVPNTWGVCAGPEHATTCAQLVVSQERPLAAGPWHYVLPYRLPRFIDPSWWEVEILEACAVTSTVDGVAHVREERRSQAVALTEREGTLRLLPFHAPSDDGARACAWRAYFTPRAAGPETMVEGRFRVAAAPRRAGSDEAPADPTPGAAPAP